MTDRFNSGDPAAAPPFARFVCDACNYIYDEATGDPDSGLPAGTRFDDIPDDWFCPVCGVSKNDFRPLPVAPRATTGDCEPGQAAHRERNLRGMQWNANTRQTVSGVLIIGAGQAGWALAQELREQGFKDPITLVSACDAIAYQKPQLSVAQTRGLPASWSVAERDRLAQTLNVQVMPDTWVIRILHEQRRVLTTRGSLRYEYIALALGAHPRMPTFTGTGNDRLLVLNDLNHYRRIDTALTAAHTRVSGSGRPVRVAIIGAGLVGCEIANDFAARGFAVSLFDVQALPLIHRMGAEQAQRLCTELQRIGVQWNGNTRIERVMAADDSQAVTIQWSAGLLQPSAGAASRSSDVSDHTENSSAARSDTFDVAIACLGLVPRTRLAESAAWPVSPAGLRVNAQTLELADHAYALGDCIEIDGISSGTIAPLMAQARCIANRITGGNARYQAPDVGWVLKTPCYPLRFGDAKTEVTLQAQQTDSPQAGDNPVYHMSTEPN